MPAQRAYGMDQDVYPWSPIIARPVLRWPDNARVALAVLVNLEHWDWEVPPNTPLAVSPLGGPEGLWSGNQPDFPDIGGYGNHEYGNRVGIFRILAVLDKYGITPTLALDKAVADHYPFLIQEGQRRDAEFIAHGLSRRRIIHIGMSEDEERQYIRDSIAAVEQATGTRPVGWSGPDFQETPHTPDLLAAAGIRYVCDWGNDEQPYKMTPKTGELYALGVNAYLDDNYIHLHGRRTINEVNLLWREWFDGLYADGATTGRLMVLHLHPWIMGQPWRIRHLDEVLGHITAHAGVWKATGSAIIDWFTAQSGEPGRLAWCGRMHTPRRGTEKTHGAAPRPVRVCPDHGTPHDPMARQRPRGVLGRAEYGVLRVPAGAPADPARYPALCAHGLRQSRRLLAHARRAEQAPGPRLLLSQPGDSWTISRKSKTP